MKKVIKSGTKILTTKGLINIEDLKVGDKILTDNFKTIKKII